MDLIVTLRLVTTTLTPPHIVVQGELPPVLRRDMESWAGCIAGALEEETYRSLLREAGFVEVEIEVSKLTEGWTDFALKGEILI